MEVQSELEVACGGGDDEVDGVVMSKEGRGFLGVGLGGGKRKMESRGVDRLSFFSFWVRRKKDEEDVEH